MSLVVATNSETTEIARKCGVRRIDFLFDAGLAGSFRADVPKGEEQYSETLRLIWTGALIPRKALVLALDAVSLAKRRVSLTIVGADMGSIRPNEMILERGLEERVRWLGKVRWDEMIGHYASSDCLLFTSLRDSLGAQIVEAAGLGLPIICLDHQGAAAFVTEEMGYRVPVSTPRETALRLAQAIDQLAQLPPGARTRLSRSSLNRSRTVTWERHIEQMQLFYQRALHNETD